MNERDWFESNVPDAAGETKAAPKPFPGMAWTPAHCLFCGRLLADPPLPGEVAVCPNCTAADCFAARLGVTAYIMGHMQGRIDGLKESCLQEQRAALGTNRRVTTVAKACWIALGLVTLNWIVDLFR